VDFRDPRVRSLLLVALATLALACGARAELIRPSAGPPLRPLPSDPLAQLVRRMDRYLREHEVNGVTMDWRYQVSPSEEIRQTVVCQLLAYVELERLRDRPRVRLEITGHADFLLGRLEEIRSHTPFDGMLAYSLLAAYELTGETRFLDAGSRVTADLMAIPTAQLVLNGGLMTAMATAEYARLAGDAPAEQKTRDIIAQLGQYQNADGSFPHWCVGSRDIHYTGWMVMELIHLERMLDDARVAPIVERAAEFLARRIGPDGKSVYEEPCPGVPGCMLEYYSRASGCSYDYDTRGWTVEPAYCTLALEHAGAPKARPVFAFLLSLEKGGTFPDLYAYWPPPDDPEYPWTIADTSVVNMSIIFWTLTTDLVDRSRRGVATPSTLDDDAESSGPMPGYRLHSPLVVEPGPAGGSCTVRFELPAPGAARVSILDPSGRRIRLIEAGVLSAGAHRVGWDGRDDQGREAPSGVYFVSLATPEGWRAARFVRLR
jgi:hypothetical protein